MFVFSVVIKQEDPSNQLEKVWPLDERMISNVTYSLTFLNACANNNLYHLCR